MVEENLEWWFIAINLSAANLDPSIPPNMKPTQVAITTVAGKSFTSSDRGSPYLIVHHHGLIATTQLQCVVAYTVYACTYRLLEVGHT